MGETGDKKFDELTWVGSILDKIHAIGPKEIATFRTRLKLPHQGNFDALQEYQKQALAWYDSLSKKEFDEFWDTVNYKTSSNIPGLHRLMPAFNTRDLWIIDVTRT